MESVEELIYKDAVYNAQKYLWFFFIYAITALPIIGLLYAQIFLRIMALPIDPGVRFAQVFAYFFIGIAMIFFGAFVLYYKFLTYLKDIFNILHLEIYDLHKYFLAASIFFIGLNVAGGYILWIGSYTIGYYIGQITTTKSMVAALTVLSRLYLRHLFFEIFYSLEVFSVFILALVTSISLRIISSRTGIFLAEVAAWIVWITASLFIVYLFVYSHLYLLVSVAVLLATLMIMLGTLSLRLPYTLLNMYSEREKLIELEIPVAGFEE